MIYYSQIDPIYRHLKIAGSNLTIGGDGCYLSSIATLGQKNIVYLLQEGMKMKYGFTADGLVYSATIAKVAGMTYLGRFKNPAKNTPCIAVTDHYKSRGVSTHFFVLLPNKKILDPLDYPCKPKENPYRITEYRLFDDVKLSVDFMSLEEEIESLKAFNSSLWNKLEGIQTELHAHNNFLRKM